MKKFSEFKINETCEFIDECPSFSELESKVNDLNITLSKVMSEMGSDEDAQQNIMEWLMDKIDTRI